MRDDAEKHIALTRSRGRAFKSIFGGEPDLIFPFHSFGDTPDTSLIDVFVYPISISGMSEQVVAAVTNGMSDHAMPDGRRCELIQYLRTCDYDCAARLYDLAWLPKADGFSLKTFETITLPDATHPTSGLCCALFLPPIIASHRELTIPVAGDEATLLWYVPITMEELRFKKERGVEALIAQMEKAALPWVFNETERPNLL